MEEIEAAIAAMLTSRRSRGGAQSLAIARLTRPVSKRLITTAAQVQRAGIGKHKVSGATGLYLRKTGEEPGGGAWVWRFWFGGKRREMGLGSLTDISLADARKRVPSFGSSVTGALIRSRRDNTSGLSSSPRRASRNRFFFAKRSKATSRRIRRHGSAPPPFEFGKVRSEDTPSRSSPTWRSSTTSKSCTSLR